jgi:hypothetical protein
MVLLVLKAILLCSDARHIVLRNLDAMTARCTSLLEVLA